MRKFGHICIIISLLFIQINAGYALQKIFYTLRLAAPAEYDASRAMIRAIQQHHQAIDMIISQAYQIDGLGTLWGSINHALQKAANDNNIKFVAMVTNQGFDADATQQFLNNPSAQARAIEGIVYVAKRYGLYGIQIDFEHIGISQRHRFTTFFKELSEALGKNNIHLSIAIVPVSSMPPASSFQQSMFNHWSGGYDYKALAQLADFVALMAYNQHGSGTPPGPVAGLPWVRAVIEYALKTIPKDKLVLGIPSYSIFWKVRKVGSKHASTGREVGYSFVQTILAKLNLRLKWDDAQQVPYIFYSENNLNEYIFAENARSFSRKLDLAKQYQLNGFALWRLGNEDPGIWPIIAKSS